MATYKSTRFTINVTNVHPNQELNYPCLHEDIIAVKNTIGYHSFKWHLAPCNSQIGGIDGNHAVGQKYPIFVGYDKNGTMLKIVAAPCPPFCTSEQGS